jgi:hypothetical protein
MHPCSNVRTGYIALNAVHCGMTRLFQTTASILLCQPEHVNETGNAWYVTSSPHTSTMMEKRYKDRALCKRNMEKYILPKLFILRQNYCFDLAHS